MSREETIKLPRLVIPRILLWLVDVYFLPIPGQYFGANSSDKSPLGTFSVINKKYVAFVREVLAV